MELIDIYLGRKERSLARRRSFLRNSRRVHSTPHPSFLPRSVRPSVDAKFINSITASYRMNIYLFSLLDQPYISGQNLFLLPICTLLSTNNAVLTAVIFSHISKLDSYKCKQILDCTRPPGPPAAFGISPLRFCYRHSCRPNENSQLLSKTSKQSYATDSSLRLRYGSIETFLLLRCPSSAKVK